MCDHQRGTSEASPTSRVALRDGKATSVPAPLAIPPSPHAQRELEHGFLGCDGHVEISLEEMHVRRLATACVVGRQDLAAGNLDNVDHASGPGAEIEPAGLVEDKPV